MVTGFKENNNMMLVVLVSVMEFAMAKVVIKGIEEWFISQQPDHRYLFCFF